MYFLTVLQSPRKNLEGSLATTKIAEENGGFGFAPPPPLALPPSSASAGREREKGGGGAKRRGRDFRAMLLGR